LLDEFGSEICWAWRLLLSKIGIAWEQTAIHSAPQIAYVKAGAPVPGAKFVIHADVEKWRRLPTMRLASIQRMHGCDYPVYADQKDVGFPDLDEQTICERDCIFDLFWLASGYEEAHLPQNRFGHFSLTEQNQESCRRAVGSAIGAKLEAHIRRFIDFEPVAPWPNGKKAAACFGHDVDYPQVKKSIEPLRILARQGKGGVAAAKDVLSGKRTHWHFQSWMDLEKSLGFRSGFYFVPVKGSLLQYALGRPDPFYDINSQKFRKLFDILLNNGFEVGLHASYNAYQSFEKFDGEKRKLAQACGSPVLGNRHHYWHLDPQNSDATLKIHESVGLLYDSSLNHENTVGWRRGLSWPFFPYLKEEKRQLQTLQLPNCWMDDHLFGHKKYNPGDPVEILRNALDTAKKQGGCFMADVHGYVYDSVLFPGWSDLYRTLLEIVAARSDFWVDTPANIAKFYIERYNIILKNSAGLEGNDSRFNINVVSA